MQPRRARRAARLRQRLGALARARTHASLVLFVLLVAAGAGAQPRDSGALPLRVFAAASLSEVVEDLARDFEHGAVVTSFGASSELARQIADGAPADVFLSASSEWVDFLKEANAIAGEPVVLARNTLVCIAPQGSSLDRAGVGDPHRLLAALAKGDVVAIADAGVPAGEYARAALAKLGVREDFEPRLVGQKDVRAVLHAVEQGEVVAGFVYGTDAKLARVETLFAFDPVTHPKVEYLAAVLRRSTQAERAQRFLDHLRSEVARARLSQAGFVLP